MAQLDLHWPRLRRFVEGSPTLLVIHGEIIPSHLRREGLDEDTLLAALREHGIAEVSGVEMAALETDGTISMIPAGSEVRRTHPTTKPLQRA